MKSPIEKVSHTFCPLGLKKAFKGLCLLFLSLHESPLIPPFFHKECAYGSETLSNDAVSLTYSGSNLELKSINLGGNSMDINWNYFDLNSSGAETFFDIATATDVTNSGNVLQGTLSRNNYTLHKKTTLISNKPYTFVENTYINNTGSTQDINYADFLVFFSSHPVKTILPEDSLGKAVYWNDSNNGFVIGKVNPQTDNQVGADLGWSYDLINPFDGNAKVIGFGNTEDFLGAFRNQP